MKEDRRVHRRFPLKLSILAQKVGLSGGELVAGRTVNVSPGGMLVEVNSGDAVKGELLNVEMSVPPSVGLLDFGSMLSSHVRVVRSDESKDSEGTTEKVIALEFCDSPKLRT